MHVLVLEGEKTRATAKESKPQHCSVTEEQNFRVITADAIQEFFETRTSTPFTKSGEEIIYAKKYSRKRIKLKRNLILEVTISELR